MDPLDKVPWFSGAIVSVIPRTMDSPDIIKIVVTRDGVQITPLVNELKPAVHQNRLGATVTLHSGGVVFPMEAFRPGAAVVLIAIPESGSNIVRPISADELARIQ
jgi:hypothetical protein